MKKREAFTLIELIAVLVILAILALIVTPLVLNIIKKAKIAADRRSVDAYGRSVELAIASHIMDTGQIPTDLDALKVEYTGKTVVCRVKQLKENGGLYMSECSVNGKEVKDSKSEDGYYHYGTRDITNEEFIDMYGDALKKASLKYLEDNGNIVSDYKTLNIDYKGKEVTCSITINYDGTIYMETCSVAGTSVPDKTYGEIVNPPSAASDLVKKANAVSVTNYNDGNKGEMYTFEHDATEQTEALTDYRYIGNVPNNYVTFNNETWRIIGVFTAEDSEGNTEQRIKLIRNEKLPSNMEWDSKHVNKWETASLNTYLNNEYYNSLTDTAKNMIDSVKYYLGGGNTSSIDGASFYNFERGTTVYSGHSTNWIGKIGLMYPSDYVYTYALGVDNTCYTDGSNCWISRGGNPSYGWIYNTNRNSFQWTMTSYSYSDRPVFYVDSNGYVSSVSSDGNLDYERLLLFVHPTLYLNPNIQIESGDGTEGSPYVFKL